MKAKTLIATLTGALLASFSFTAAHAGIASTLVKGAINSLQDDSVELVFDVDGNGTYSVGDINVVVVRINNRQLPTNSGLLGADEIIAVSSIVLTSAAPGPGGLVWAPTPAASPFSLASLGVSNTSPTTVAAVFENVGFDPIATLAPIGSDGDAASNDLRDNVAAIAALGAPSLVYGLGGPGDFFVGTDVGGVLAPGGLTLPISTTTVLALFKAGLTLEVNNIGVDFEREVCAGAIDLGGIPNQGCFAGLTPLDPASLHDLVLVGQLKGAAGVTTLVAGCTMGGTLALGCLDVAGSVAYYGQTDNATFNVAPVPEPGTLALLGLGLLGLGFGRRRLAA